MRWLDGVLDSVARQTRGDSEGRGADSTVRGVAESQTRLSVGTATPGTSGPLGAQEKTLPHPQMPPVQASSLPGVGSVPQGRTSPVPLLVPFLPAPARTRVWGASGKGLHAGWTWRGPPDIPWRHLRLAVKTVYICSPSVGERLPAESSPAWSPGKGPSPAVCDFPSGEKEHAGLALKDAPGHTHRPGFQPRQCDLEPVA